MPSASVPPVVPVKLWPLPSLLAPALLLRFDVVASDGDGGGAFGSVPPGLRRLRSSSSGGVLMKMNNNSLPQLHLTRRLGISGPPPNRFGTVSHSTSRMLPSATCVVKSTSWNSVPI